MIAISLGAAVMLALVTGAALIRVARGPTDADRMLGIQLIGTSLAGLGLLLAEGFQAPRLVDLALVVAALTSVTGAAFVSIYTRRKEANR